MNDESRILTPEEQRAREAVGTLARVPAAVAFRERLKRDFVAGRIGETRALTLGAARGRRIWGMAFAATAAVAALVAVLSIANRAPGWTMIEPAGDGVAVIDRTPVPLAHLPEQPWRLRGGSRIELPAGSRLELASEGVFVIEIEGGSTVTIPPPPRRWIGRTVAASVERGVMRLATGPRFRGARLRVSTPEALVTVTGTALAVICEPAGTCVCVHEGEVMVGARGAAAEPVTAGRRRFIFHDGRPPENAAMRPGERERLGDILLHRHDLIDVR